jgi:hypothetical protein
VDLTGTKMDFAPTDPAIPSSWHSKHSNWTRDNFIRNNEGQLTLVIDGETGEVVK